VALPTDIVAVFYSGSVNIGANNSQSLASIVTPTLLIDQGNSLKSKDKRLFQKPDNIFLASVSGLIEFVIIAEKLGRKFIPIIAMETVTISESLLRKPKPKIANETVTISESLLRKVIRPITETKTIAETLLRKPIPKIAAETISISETLKRPFIRRRLTETITISEAVSRGGSHYFRSSSDTISISETLSPLRKVIKRLIEGECSIFFNGLSGS